MKKFFISQLGLSILLELFPTASGDAKDDCNYAVNSAPVINNQPSLFIKYPKQYSQFDGFIVWVTDYTEAFPFRKFQVHGLMKADRVTPLRLRTLFLDKVGADYLLKWGKGQHQQSIFKFYGVNLAYTPRVSRRIDAKCFSIDGVKRLASDSEDDIDTTPTIELNDRIGNWD